MCGILLALVMIEQIMCSGVVVHKSDQAEEPHVGIYTFKDTQRLLR